MSDPIGWRDITLGVSAAFTGVLGVLWRRMTAQLDGKCDRNEIKALLDQFAEHVQDDRELLREIREDRKASESSRDELHRKFNRISLSVARLDERLAAIGTRAGEPLGRPTRAHRTTDDDNGV